MCTTKSVEHEPLSRSHFHPNDFQQIHLNQDYFNYIFLFFIHNYLQIHCVELDFVQSSIKNQMDQWDNSLINYQLPEANELEEMGEVDWAGRLRTPTTMA